mmetsp:Transcript_22418/g.68306  ORF Transcript_22418/g.68306 Transcript_22418/m.68306 type:complete len:110 (-) Transcript_22418:2109-2438(-)|eukprot:scaffold184507_cov33-Tisochrysis_lutea.AAC.4
MTARGGCGTEILNWATAGARVVSGRGKEPCPGGDLCSVPSDRSNVSVIISRAFGSGRWAAGDALGDGFTFPIAANLCVVGGRGDGRLRVDGDSALAVAIDTAVGVGDWF